MAIVRTSADPAEFITITRQSAETKDIIRIIELSEMGKIMPHAEAEAIRSRLVANKVMVRQLTNLPQFEPWTAMPGFIDTCMQVRFVPPSKLPITTEVLIFGDTVAMYRLQPEPWIVIIKDAAVAAQHKALFDCKWQQGTPLKLQANGAGGLR